MNTILKFLTVAAIAVAAFTLHPAASAAGPDQYDHTELAYTNAGATTLNGGTNHIPATATNTLNSPITLTKHGDFALFINFKLNGAGTSVAIFRFEHSVDGTNYTANAHNLSITANGTTAVSGGPTNLTVGPTGYWRLATVENPNASAITNLVVSAYTKPQRYGGQGGR